MAQKPTVEASTQAYLPINEIKEGVIVLDDGSLRSVIIVSSFNFALKSEDEKNAIVVSYQDFLNSLDFPIQIIANSRKLDLENYLAQIKNASNSQENPLIKYQTEEYHSFIEQLLEVSNIMEKRFYVVVPYYPLGINVNTGLPNPFNKKQQPQTTFEDSRGKLLSRVEEVITGLSSVGLRCAALGTEDLLELYYSLYNPDTAKNQKIKGLEEIETTVTQSENIAQPPGGQVGTL